MNRQERIEFAAVICFLVLLPVAAGASVAACASTPAPTVAKTEADLCEARAAWRIAAAADPSLAPAPGSLRAKLEAAEDALCSTVTQ